MSSAVSHHALRAHRRAVRSSAVIDLGAERASRRPEDPHTREYFAHAVLSMTSIFAAVAILIATALPYGVQPVAGRLCAVLIPAVLLSLSAFAVKMYRDERRVE